MYYNIEVINNINLDSFHRNQEMLFSCCKCWSLLAARQIQKYDKYRFQYLKNLQNLGHFLLTVPGISYVSSK